jgi:site-specific recombinase XerD
MCRYLFQSLSLIELAPSPKTLMGLRDRAILGMLVGCGLRRDELANLTFEHLQQREHLQQPGGPSNWWITGHWRSI